MRDDETRSGGGARRRGKAREGSLLSLVAGFGGASVWKDRPLRELLRWADDLAARPDPTLERDGWAGSKGSLSVIWDGLVFHAYFLGDAVQFEIGARDDESRGDRPLTGRETLAGRMSIPCLKETLRLVADGRSPFAHLWTDAARVRLSLHDD